MAPIAVVDNESSRATASPARWASWDPTAEGEVVRLGERELIAVLLLVVVVVTVEGVRVGEGVAIAVVLGSQSDR